MTIMQTIKVSRPATADIRISLTGEGEFCVDGDVVAFINQYGELELDYIDEDSPLQTEVHNGAKYIKVVR